MTDQLVSFETAKLSEKKGLQFMLDIGSNCMVYNKYNSSEQPSSYHVHTQYPDKDHYLYAPTQSLLQKWLREVHNLHVTVYTFYRDGIFLHRVCKVKEHVIIWSMDEFSMSFREFHTYEEALEQGLQEALKLIP